MTVALLAGTLLSLVAASAAAQSWTMPPPSQRCPSKWGAGDTRGAANHQTAAAVLRATQLIRTGEVVEIAHPLNARMPFFGTRRFDVHMKRTFMNEVSNRRASNEELVISEIGQVGTQLDGLAHATHEDLVYNCFKVSEIATRGGVNRFGMDGLGMLMTRGVMLDIAGLKGVATLPDTYEITVEDLEAALQRQRVRIQPGDAVLINTGWGLLYGKDNARFTKSSPGIGIKAAEYLVKLDPMLIGADTWAVEVMPNPDPALSAPVHQITLVINGIYLLENVKLDELVAKRMYEFAFIMQPLKASNLSGSTVAPVAVR